MKWVLLVVTFDHNKEATQTIYFEWNIYSNIKLLANHLAFIPPWIPNELLLFLVASPRLDSTYTKWLSRESFSLSLSTNLMLKFLLGVKL
jgi:hypothetical protein